MKSIIVAFLALFISLPTLAQPTEINASKNTTSQTAKKKVKKTNVGQNLAVPATWVLWNIDNDVVIDSANDSAVRPMASITKLMSVFVTVKSNLDTDEMLTVVGREHSNRIRPGMRMTRGSLLELALVSSDNLAARTLAETYPGGYNKFIDHMNETARELGMNDTVYQDATGLLATNTSSAQDIKQLVLAATNFGVFKPAANAVNVVVEAVSTVKRNTKEVKIVASNTNNFVGKLDIEVAKTGYTSRAGRCLTMMFQENGTKYLLVVMGAVSPQHRTNLVNQLIDKIR